jgi:phosphohistidine swiveling domain-containing protein
MDLIIEIASQCETRLQHDKQFIDTVSIISHRDRSRTYIAQKVSGERMTDGWLIDTVPSERFPIYTRLNANDVLPDPITPLGASLGWVPHIIPGFSLGYASVPAITAQEAMGNGSWPAAAFFYGHLYVNMTIARTVGVRNGLGYEVVDAAFFGSHPDAPPHTPHPEDANEEISAAIAERTEWTLTTTTYPEIEEERALADRVRQSRPDFTAMSPAALVAWARAMMPIERLMWRSEMVAGTQSAVGPAVIAQVVGELDPTALVKLLGSSGDVDSAQPSFALWDLSRLVRADPAVGKEFDAGETGLLGRLQRSEPEFAAAFQGFLNDFGFRGPSEWDLGAPSWETQPQLPLALIDRIRQLDDNASPAARLHEQEDGSETGLKPLLEGLDEAEQQVLQGAIASARRFAAWRERGKTNCIKVLHEARLALDELARRMTAGGHIERPQQLFMALDSELDVLALDPGSLSQTLKDREIQWLGLFGLELPLFVEAGAPMKPLSQLRRRGDHDEKPLQAGESLQGVPASPGVARGRARVIMSPAAIADFQPGEVLIAPQTDPSWTPLFLVSAGVVVDVGAMNSHAMIVSRELGIPCAAGFGSATRRITDGMLVEVDGAAGTVTALDG